MATDYADNRYWHIEYATVDQVDPEVIPSHYVDIARDDETLERKLGPILNSMTGHGDTYAVHVRLIGSDIRNEKIYSEKQPLAVAMNDAHRLDAKLDALTKKYFDLNASKAKLVESYEREVEILEKKLAAKGARIDLLEMRIDRVRYRAQRDLNCCVTMEPEEVLGIVDGHGDESMVASAEAMREKLLEILPTEPMGEKFNSDNQYKAALAEWGVYEQIAEILGVALPVAAVEGRVADGE